MRIRNTSKLWLILAGATASMLLAVTAFLWFIYASPFGYQPPPGLSVIEDRAHRVFAYGTLGNSSLRRLIVGRTVEVGTAVLRGYRKQGLDVVPSNSDRVEGVVFEVSADELRRLDRFERVGIRYTRVLLILADGEPAWVYRRIP